MAQRGPSYGLSAEVQARIDSKRDPELDRQARDWIIAVTGEQIDQDLHVALKDGQVLCRLINKIKPGSVKKINKGAMPFMQMENIGSFLTAVQALGVPDHDRFQTVDLFEAQNMGQVTQCIFGLSRQARVAGFAGPFIGPKLADRHDVEFTDEQLRSADSVIPLQNKGSHGNANASGMIDTSREIVKLK